MHEASVRSGDKKAIRSPKLTHVPWRFCVIARLKDGITPHLALVRLWAHCPPVELISLHYRPLLCTFRNKFLPQTT
jgi:hypothetical protein